MKIENNSAILMQSVASLFHVEGERVSVVKGATPTAADFALYIGDAIENSQANRSRAAWAFYEAGKMTDGAKVQKEIVETLLAPVKGPGGKVLREPLSKSAVYQVVSAGRLYAPLIAEGGFKTTLSVLKDAAAALVFNGEGAEKKLAPLAEQNEAGQKLIPLLKSGQGTQAKFREIRKDIPVDKGGTKKVEAAPAAPETPEQKEAREYASFRIHLNATHAFVMNASVDVWDAATVALVVDIGRKMGMAVSVPNAKK